MNTFMSFVEMYTWGWPVLAIAGLICCLKLEKHFQKQWRPLKPKNKIHEWIVITLGFANCIPAIFFMIAIYPK